MDTYRLSQSHLRWLALSFWISIFVVGTAVVWQILEGELAQTSGLVLGALILIAAGFYFGRTRKRELAWAKAHTFSLSADGILLRDGPTEFRIPYASIEQMHVRKALFGARWFSLKIAGQGSQRYYGYENIDQLIEAIASKIGLERVRGAIAPNKSLERSRDR